MVSNVNEDYLSAVKPVAMAMIGKTFVLNINDPVKRIYSPYCMGHASSFEVKAQAHLYGDI